ncbi:MAG: polysaccharide deacetylase family protein [Alphaproteobacteria bacterium]|nr:polysaccharide deacetylase family protein [Alphaproteobacteria bacterium]
MRLVIFVLALLLALPARAETTFVSILTYHRFNPQGSTGATTVSTKVFAAQMARIAERAIPVVVLRAVVLGEGLPARAVAITADDGHRSVYTEMFPILKRHGFHATLFLNPPGLGQGSYLRWEEIAEMLASGLIDCAPHTISHPNFPGERARRTPPDFARFLARELRDPREVLAARLGVAADLLAWPYGIHDAELEEAAEAAGYLAAFALGGRAAPAGAPRFAIPRYQVYEADIGARFDAVLNGVPRSAK